MTAARQAGLGALGALAAAQWVPSVVSLGQWLPVRSLPGGWCTWRGPARAAVALTFDDGPDPVATPAVLDALERLGLRATFFCLGERAAAHPDLVAEVARRGHAVGVHGHRHTHHLLRAPWHPGADLDRALAALAAAGVAPRWYRPPYGQASGATLLAARRRGLRTVLWSAWGREWAAPDAAAVARRVTSALTPGAVVLLHDSDGSSPAGSAGRAAAALAPIAAALDEAGLRTATLDELLDGAGAGVAACA